MSSMFAVASTTILAKYSARARPGKSMMVPSGVRKSRRSTIQVLPTCAQLSVKEVERFEVGACVELIRPARW
jgi:hypothetical protein